MTWAVNIGKYDYNSLANSLHIFQNDETNFISRIQILTGQHKNTHRTPLTVAHPAVAPAFAPFFQLSISFLTKLPRLEVHEWWHLERNCHPHLINHRHSFSRLRDYKSNERFSMPSSGPYALLCVWIRGSWRCESRRMLAVRLTHPIRALPP